MATCRAEQIFRMLLGIICTLTLLFSRSQVRADFSSCLTSCCIYPYNSTVKYGQWLNLTFIVEPCSITAVHWYTTGTRQSFGNSDLLPRDDVKYVEPNACDNNTKEFHIQIKITEETHRILHGAVFAVGSSENVTCFSLPLVRYYITIPPGTTSTPPTSDDDVRSSPTTDGVIDTLIRNNSATPRMGNRRWTLSGLLVMTALSLI